MAVTVEDYMKVRRLIDTMRGTKEARCTCTCHVTHGCQPVEREDRATS